MIAEKERVCLLIGKNREPGDPLKEVGYLLEWGGKVG
jgi:hypothetical protein